MGNFVRHGYSCIQSLSDLPLQRSAAPQWRIARIGNEMKDFVSWTAAMLLLALSSIIVPCKTQTAVIHPLSYTARLNSAGTFHCAVTGSNIISWYVNRIPSGYEEIRNRGILTSSKTFINTTYIQSNLTVPATLENDGISINCAALVYGEQTSGFSETAVFHVQGPPPPPINLTLEVSRDQSHLTLRWNSPFEISFSNDSVISMYTVYIFQTGAEAYYNTTMKEYSIKNPCNNAKFKVTAWNDVGEGTATRYLIYTHNLTAISSGCMQAAIILPMLGWELKTEDSYSKMEGIVPSTLQASVAFNASGEPTAQLLFQINNSCFHQRLKDGLRLFHVATKSVCLDITHQQGPLMLNPTIINSTVIFNIPHLPSNCRITATVQSQNWSNSSSNITFATYGVQDVEISEGTLPNSVCTTCIFAEGSDVRGCYVRLLEEHYSLVTNISGIHIGREGDILNATGCIDKLKSDTFHVVVYDIEADGTVDWRNRALFITASLNFTSSLDELNTDAPSVSIVMTSSNFTLQKDLTVFIVVGATGGGALLLVVTIVILCALLVRKCHCTTINIKQSSRDDARDMEMKRNEIYGQLPQQQVARNPAYNWWYPS